MDTRQKILTTVIDHITRSPLEENGVRDLAAKAGVNVAAINYHFGSKDWLFTEAINKIVNDNLDNWLAANINMAQPTKKDLLKFLVELHQNTITYRNFSRTKMHHLISADQPDEANARIFDTLCDLLGRLGVKTREVPLRASILFNSLISFSISPDTATAHAGIQPSRPDVENYIQKLLKIVLNQ